MSTRAIEARHVPRSPEAKRRLGRVYAWLLRLEAKQDPDADQAARPGASGPTAALPEGSVQG